MSGNNDDIPENIRAMADIPPPPPPAPPLNSPTGTPLQGRPRSGSLVDANNSIASPPPDNDSGAMLSPPLMVEIEEGTPAAEALKANADVRVSKLRKVGRSTRLQAGVRVLKSAARTASGQPGHAGDRRGAPAFVAPRGSSSNLQSTALAASGQPPPTIPEVDDEMDSDYGDMLMGSPKGTAMPADEAAEGWSIADKSVGDESASQSHPLDTSVNLDDSSIDRDKQFPGTPSTAPSSSEAMLLLAQHPVQRQNNVTHAALPAAIAAACRAGEDMDRKRATLIDNTHNRSDSNLDTGSLHKSPFANLFKSTAQLSVNADENASPVKMSPRPAPRHRRQLSVPERSNRPKHTRSLTIPSNHNEFEVFRRVSMERVNRMPSEISVAETEKHTNIRDHDIHQLLDEELSDDGELTEITGEISDVQIKKHVEVNPIVVEIPGSNHHMIEESKEEEELDRAAVMAKAKKRISRRGTKKPKHGVDDDAFAHFHGPKSVRKFINRRRSKEESKNQRSYVKGKVIDGKHELYTMSIAVMFGMRTSIGRTNMAMSQTAHNERRWLDNDDLMAVEKYEFPPRGSDMTPPHQLNHTFKFKDYSPLAFAYLRRMFGVNEYDFLLSVCGNANYIEFQSNAKSGQFFFYSPDGKYMIKTMTNTESKFLRRILPHYFRHCATNPNTLITKFLGMYRVKLYHLKRNVKFVVMKSVYDTDKFLNQLFDLKGSSTGREAKPSDAVKKDNDLRRNLPDGAFVLEPGLRERLRTQVSNDCEWLQSMKIMDYSMLIGIHNIAHRSTKKPMTGLSITQPVRNFSNDDNDDRSNASYDASNATLDRYLDVDDDDSFLDGAHAHTKKGSSKRVAYDTSSTSDEAVRTVRVLVGGDNGDDESSKGSKKASEALVEKAIEDMYWPFHRFYDIQGLRRMKPIHDSLIAPESKKYNEGKQTEQPEGKPAILKALFPPTAHSPMSSCEQYDLSTFERPLSYRKDGGFMMDTTGTDLPLKTSVAGAPHMSEYCDGKIFYMGIIDILQQFNIRKRLEARYRRLGGKGWEAASCVHPSVYADRFNRFFDEYTEGPPRSMAEGGINENGSVTSSRSSNRSDISWSQAVKRKSL
ncbi:hypothetical protein ACHAXR_009969 [Thalassiosira sp. AJA248-18]